MTNSNAENITNFVAEGTTITSENVTITPCMDMVTDQEAEQILANFRARKDEIKKASVANTMRLTGKPGID